LTSNSLVGFETINDITLELVTDEISRSELHVEIEPNDTKTFNSQWVPLFHHGI
ncbi:11801_t:CDS:1, partial [Racocetra persica]